MQRTEGFVMLSLVLGQADLWWMVGLLFNSHMQLRLAEPGQLAHGQGPVRGALCRGPDGPA